MFSLGSQGTLANTLTTQKRGGSTLLRRKPTPSDPYSLPQAYQRWLYEDYAYWWTLQSAAIQAEFRSAGVRHHLTGFQYWIKYNLTHLPHISGIWHLDEKSGATAIDFSRKANHGAIIGASPTDGVIDGAFLFDGLNDRVRVPTTPSLEMDSIFSIEFFITLRRTATWEYLISKGQAWIDGWWLQKDAATTTVAIKIVGDSGNESGIIGNLVLDKPTHILVALNLPNWQSYIDGVPGGGGVALSSKILGTTTSNLNFASGPGGIYWSEIDLDHIILYNRQLDAADAIRHSERRYPL